MVYKRSYKKAPYNRRPGWKTYKSYKYRTQRYANILKPFLGLNTERKHLDTSINSAFSSTGSCTNMVAMAQGTDDNERIGRKIRLSSVNGHCIITQHASATESTVRLILFYWFDDDDPTLADLLDASSQPHSNLNVHKSMKFKVVINKMITLSSVSRTASNFNFYRKLNQRVDYDGTTSTSHADGSLWWGILSDEATNTPTVKMHTRVRYVDN